MLEESKEETLETTEIPTQEQQNEEKRWRIALLWDYQSVPFETGLEKFQLQEVLE